MQTFLPYESFVKSARCLDNARLISQRNEAILIFERLLDHTAHWKNPDAWKNHPAVRMWKGHIFWLCEYISEIINEYNYRRFNDFVDKHRRYTKIHFLHIDVIRSQCEKPVWLGDKAFHDSHKSNLLRKYPEHYSHFNWDVPDNLPYVWPVEK